MRRVDEDAKKWRRDVGLTSLFSNTRPALPRLLALLPLGAALTALSICLPLDLRPLAIRSCCIGLGAYVTTVHLVPVISKKIPKSKFGCDLLKRPPRLQINDNDKIGFSKPDRGPAEAGLAGPDWAWAQGGLCGCPSLPYLHQNN